MATKGNHILQDLTGLEMYIPMKASKTKTGLKQKNRCFDI